MQYTAYFHLLNAIAKVYLYNKTIDIRIYIYTLRIAGQKAVSIWLKLFVDTHG